MIPAKTYYELALAEARRRRYQAHNMDTATRWLSFSELRGAIDATAVDHEFPPLASDDTRRRRIIGAAIIACQARFYNDSIPKGYRAALPDRRTPFTARFYGRNNSFITELDGRGTPAFVETWAHGVKTALHAASFVVTFRPPALGLDNAHLNLTPRAPITITDTSPILPAAIQ